MTFQAFIDEQGTLRINGITLDDIKRIALQEPTKANITLPDIFKHYLRGELQWTDEAQTRLYNVINRMVRDGCEFECKMGVSGNCRLNQ
jgi:hypothetical protein